MKITRTPTRATGGITAEEEQKLRAISQKWIKNAFRTDTIDKEKITDAIIQLYHSAGLKTPRVVIVPSPYVGRLACGIASAVWYLRKNTDAATYAATDAATRIATDAATYDAATDAATAVWLKKIIQNFTPNNEKFTTECIKSSRRMYQGGNMWAGFLAYAEGMRDVIGLTGLDCWAKYQAWEDAGREGGFRYMHEEFCIVSDFPEILKVDGRNRPHSEVGPSHRWRDGFEIYHLNGVRLHKELWQSIVNRTIPTKDAIQLKNQEHRTLALQYIGGSKLEKDLGGVVKSKDEYGSLIELTELKDQNGRNYLYYKAIDPSKNEYIYLRTHPDTITPTEAMYRAYKLDAVGIKNYQPNLRT